MLDVVLAIYVQVKSLIPGHLLLACRNVAKASGGVDFHPFSDKVCTKSIDKEADTLKGIPRRVRSERASGPLEHTLLFARDSTPVRREAQESATRIKKTQVSKFFNFN